MHNQDLKSIRQSAAAGPFPEWTLRQMLKQGKLPGIYSGKKFLVNYPLLLKMLDEESTAQVTRRESVVQ